MSPTQRWHLRAAAQFAKDLHAVDPHHADNYVRGLYANADPKRRLFHQYRQVADHAATVLHDLNRSAA